jgi:hypothetical protein
MLVCNVSLLRRRASIAAELAESAAARDAPGTGDVVFATLVDDPASVGDHIDAYLGEIMLEAANAAATVTAGLAYARAVSEAASAADLLSSSVPIAGTVAETAAGNSTQDATVVSGVAYATWDPATVTAVTLSGSNLVATNTGTTSADQGAKVASAAGKTSGKLYLELTITTSFTGGNRGFGICTTASTYTNLGNSATTGVVMYWSGSVYANGGSTGVSIPSVSAGTPVGMAVDLDNRKMWIRSSAAGTWNNSGTANPATNVGGFTIPAGTMVPVCVFGGGGGSAGNVVTANFGASTFNGAVPSGFTSGWT